MKKKISEEQIKNLRLLISQGITLKAASLQLGISYSQAKYHQSDEMRAKMNKATNHSFMKKPLAVRRMKYHQVKDYQRRYHRERYHNDPLFRKKQIEATIKYQNKKK